MAGEGGGEHYLVERLRERFAEDPRVGELGLEVTVVAGILHVHGEVASEGRRRAVSRVAREVVPDLEVRNEVQVTAVAGQSGGFEVLS